MSNPYANFETTSRFLSQFLYPSSVSWKITPLCTFLAQTIYTLLKSNPLKWKLLRLSSQNSSNSSCQLWNDKSVPVQFLLNSSFLSQITPILIYKLILFQVWIKGSRKNPNFGCPWKNLRYFSCHCPNHKSLESNVR